MEKKTIGEFISALRKASGMTQKDLAQKLNVSDKAVSRWERDECAPDLSLIPVIADIFGVTADELLRGQRKSIANTSAPTNELGDFSTKSKKQIKYLLTQSLMKYKIQCLISSAVALVGFIVAAIINALNHAYIGLGVGSTFYIIASALLATFTIVATYHSNSEEFETADTNAYKKSVAYIAWLTASVIFILFCITTPLIFANDTYFGLTPFAWFGIGLIGAAIGITISLLARFIITNSLITREIVSLPEKVRQNRKTIVKTYAICAAVIAVTLIVQGTFNSIADSKMLFAQGTTFDNYEDFKAHMETPDNAQTDEWVMVKVSDTDYYDDYTEQTITDENGNELCRYICRNESVCRIHYSNSDDQLPITVYDYNDCSNHNDIMDIINILFIAVYLCEIIIFTVIYRKKRAK